MVKILENLFISNMTVTDDLIIFYNDMVDLAMIVLPPGDMAKGKKNILEAMINKWKFIF